MFYQVNIPDAPEKNFMQDITDAFAMRNRQHLQKATVKAFNDGEKAVFTEEEKFAIALHAGAKMTGIKTDDDGICRFTTEKCAIAVCDGKILVQIEERTI